MTVAAAYFQRPEPDPKPDTEALIQGDHSPDNVKFPDNSMTFP